MELIHWFVDLVLHLDDHLVELLRDYGFWVYAILFLIVFAETGFVVTPFLPGDSLLFAAGFAASGGIEGFHPNVVVVCVCLTLVAVAGAQTGFHIGHWIGPPAFSGRVRFLKVEYLRRTEAFFEKHGSLTIVLSRFAPIVRTCAPFVAGVGRMPYARFQTYNVIGALCWVLLFVWAGYFIGNIPFIKDNFGLVTIGIVVVSLIPVAWVALKKE